MELSYVPEGVSSAKPHGCCRDRSRTAGRLGWGSSCIKRRGQDSPPHQHWLQICSQRLSSPKHPAPSWLGESQDRPGCLCDLADAVIQNRVANSPPRAKTQSKALLPSLIFSTSPCPCCMESSSTWAWPP